MDRRGFLQVQGDTQSGFALSAYGYCVAKP